MVACSKYWILRWKLVLKRFLPFSEMPWKISGTFTGSFTDGCLLLVGSCQLKLLQAIDIPVFVNPHRVDLPGLFSGLGALWFGPCHLTWWGFWWYSEYTLRDEMGWFSCPGNWPWPKKNGWCPFPGLRWNPGNSQRLTVLILWLAIMWEMILTACGIGKG